MINSTDEKFNRFCLVVLNSKKAIEFDRIQQVCAKMAKYGYYFDKISRVPYDSVKTITAEFINAKQSYENIIVLCPKAMELTVKNYLSSLFNASFNALGIIEVDRYTVVVIFNDADNRVLDTDVRDILVNKYGTSCDKCYVRFVGAPQDLIESTLFKARTIYQNSQTQGEIYFNLTGKFEDFKLEIVYSSAAPKMLIDEVQRCIVGGLGEYIYALEDITLAEQLYRLLKLRRLKISVAESFTGGGIAKKLVEVAGVSEVYSEGLNTYSNESKMRRLGVTELTLKQNGAVSAETAFQMADGLLRTGECDISISSTGIAGPASDNTSKPVGLAFIGIGYGDDISVYKFNFGGDRENITNCAINRALFLAYKKLK